ncbi:unnamed protein product [Paramecium octaurelia]|uniref:Transmembrane protein n=1 Tax=Paramecium octaurelia TaxID=43137 RepID=A0A8S1WFQ6_PAROT|nr:unnamed protein product [Paramecium octaurelia]
MTFSFWRLISVLMQFIQVILCLLLAFKNVQLNQIKYDDEQPLIFTLEQQKINPINQANLQLNKLLKYLFITNQDMNYIRYNKNNIQKSRSSMKQKNQPCKSSGNPCQKRPSNFFGKLLKFSQSLFVQEDFQEDVYPIQHHQGQNSLQEGQKKKIPLLNKPLKHLLTILEHKSSYSSQLEQQ